MSSLLSPDSSHLLRRRWKSNNGKTAAAAAAAVLVLLPSGSAHHPTYTLLSSEPSSSLTPWPTTPSPVSSPEVEYNPFLIQLDPPDPDINLDSPLSSSHSQHLAKPIIFTNSDETIPAVKPRRGRLAKRASLQTDPKDSSAALPEPFDTSLGTHFESSTCGPFIQRMVTDPDFQACHPFSLLLSTSNGFFHSLRGTPGAPSLANVLGSTCAADVDNCGTLIDRFATRLSASEACGSELEKHNALAVEALAGLQNFRLMRAAGCMQADAPALTPNSTRLQPRTSDSSSSSPDQSATPTTSSNTTTGSNQNSTVSTSSNNATDTSATLQSSTPTTPESSQTYCFEAAAKSKRPDDLVCPFPFHYFSHTEQLSHSFSLSPREIFSIIIIFLVELVYQAELSRLATHAPRL